MIDDEVIKAAKQTARSWAGNPRFTEEDAFQAAIEGVLKKKDKLVGKPIGWKVMAMREEIRDQSLKSRFVMVVGKNMATGEVPGKIKPLGYSTDDLVEINHDALQEQDPCFDEVTDSVLVGQLLDDLTDRERHLVEKWMQGESRKMNSRTRAVLKNALARLKALHTEGEEK